MNSPQVKMYNLNVNVATALSGGLLGIESASTTPRTPEILNSLIAMTNPFENFSKMTTTASLAGSDESCSTSGSPLASPTNSPPSVQHTCSQLIKEGLKLTLQTKRKQSGSDSKDDYDELEIKIPKREELTQEDEERRRRRRERNKIAATKCRQKKREKTVNLVSESEILETQNVELKSQIQDLEAQKSRLLDMLSMHAPNCVKHNASTVFDDDLSYISELNEIQLNNNDFRVDSVMNPFSKDPNFGKDEQFEKDEIPSESNFARMSSFAHQYPSTSQPSANFMPSRNVLRINEGNKTEYRKVNPQVFRNTESAMKRESNDHLTRLKGESYCCRQYNTESESESYKPNGVVDDFFPGKGDNAVAGFFEYPAFPGNMEPGCLA